MFTRNGFSRRANAAVTQAVLFAAKWGHTYIGSEHLLLGVLACKKDTAAIYAAENGLYFENTRDILLQKRGKGSLLCLTASDFTPHCRAILQNAVIHAGRSKSRAVNTTGLLWAIVQEKNSSAAGLLRRQNINTERLSHLLAPAGAGSFAVGSAERQRRPAASSVRTGSRTAILERHSRDLTELARCGRIDPVAEREEELDRMIQVLCRRTKNNPCIIGEAGVGKTALAEGLALRIAQNRVPEPLRGMRLVSLDLSSLVAGTKYRGDFEERINALTEEVCAAGNILLFIDEIHNLVGTGVAEGSVDAANILKPKLARGELRVIGATTGEEYRKYIEKDAALDRRFQGILLEEPDREKTVAILKELCKKYETFHRVSIGADAIEAAVDLSVRYLPHLHLPDKAIDLLDEAAASLRLKSSPKKGGTKTAAPAVLQKEKDLPVLTAQHIAGLLARSTGIDVCRLSRRQSMDLLSLEAELHKTVLGQEEAVSAVARAIRRSRAGLGDGSRPIGCFLFLGPTGVGKTQLCKTLAAVLFGREQALIQFDMTEYMEPNSLARFLGSPPGYVGYDNATTALQRLREKPYSVVLFDEIEKAHPDVLGILLQAMEEGTVTDTKGRKISFRNAVVVMTSNIGWQYASREAELGFAPCMEEERERHLRKSVMGELRRFFRPEFLNRLDEVVVFRRLEPLQRVRITQMMLERTVAALKEKGITASFSPQVAEAVSRQGCEPENGARPLRRAVQRLVEDPLAELMLKGEITQGDHIDCGWKNGLTVEKLPATAV